MASRSLFNLILKVIGIFFIRDILEALSHTLSVLVYFPQYGSGNEAVVNLASTLPALILYILIAWLFIFKSEGIINLLRLEKNVTGLQVPVTIERTAILKAAVVIAGFWIFVNEIPEFLRQAVYYFQERKFYARMTRPDISYPAMSAIRLMIGLILIVFNRLVVRIIEWGSRSRKAAIAG